MEHKVLWIMRGSAIHLSVNCAIRKMKLTWVNHASFIVESGDVRLICDPWMEGRVFNQSWELLAKTVFTCEDFSKISHLWFSHEHPDHFFPPNIMKIPVKFRKQITVLYQKTIDGKVKEFCRNAGFRRIIEMSGGVEYRLGEDFSVINDKMRNDTDSWLLIRTGGATILNVNDCVFRKAAEMKKIRDLAGRIDVLITQFSYAAWAGNKGDAELMKAAASGKKEEIRRQIHCFRPEFTIPFASFVWFCHADNYHMNEYANRPGDICAFIKGIGGKPVLLYPGQEWDLQKAPDSSEAIRNYDDDIAGIAKRTLTVFPPETVDKLKESAEANRKHCLALNNRRKLLSYRPYTVFISDHGKAYSYSYLNGLKEVRKDRDACDVSMSSQSFNYCLSHDWGYSTIHIAGTFEKPSGGNYGNVEEYMWIGSLNNRGERMGGVIVRALAYLRRMIGSER